ncbi:MAG: phage integrase N-terminal SAM-like domain-containing protein [Clostridium sp.]|nr:phage integrase N-terminal SAM-like domain-containing protein [Clostridium sp.]
MRDLHYPQSEYISDKTRQLWEEMVNNYCFQDTVIEKTVQNYSSTVNILCDYHKKDFICITEEEAQEFLQYLDLRVAGKVNGERTLSVATAFTYKKNLRSVGNYFEQLLEGYRNPFKKGIVKTAQIKEHEWENRSAVRREQVRKEDVGQLLISVKDHEAPQYYFILCMLVFLGVASYDICTMKTKQIEYKEGQLYLHFVRRKMLAKTRNTGRTEERAELGYEEWVYTLPEKIDREFKEYCDKYFVWLPDNHGSLFAFPSEGRKKGLAPYAEEESNEEAYDYVFYNRNRNPVNFKTISSVLKKHKEKLEIAYPLTTKELSGSLYRKQYVAEIKREQDGVVR